MLKILAHIIGDRPGLDVLSFTACVLQLLSVVYSDVDAHRRG